MSEKPLFQPRFSTNSWHRRLAEEYYGRFFFIRIYGEEVPRQISICRYFWSVIWALITYPVFRLLHLFVDRDASKSFSPLGTWFLVTIILNFFIFGSWFVLKFLGIIAGLVIIMTLSMIGLSKLSDFMEGRSKPKPEKTKPPSKPKQPSVLTEYLKARKAKVCPYIEWVKEE